MGKGNKGRRMLGLNDNGSWVLASEHDHANKDKPRGRRQARAQEKERLRRDPDQA